jgi:hypothetical protein
MKSHILQGDPVAQNKADLKEYTMKKLPNPMLSAVPME